MGGQNRGLFLCSPLGGMYHATDNRRNALLQAQRLPHQTRRTRPRAHGARPHPAVGRRTSGPPPRRSRHLGWPVPRRRRKPRRCQPPPRLSLELPRTGRRGVDGAPAGHRFQGMGHGRTNARQRTAHPARAHSRYLLHPTLRRSPAPSPRLPHRRPPLPPRRGRLHRRRAAQRRQLHGLARKPPLLLPDFHLSVPPRPRRNRLRKSAH